MPGVSFVPFETWVPDGKAHGLDGLGIAENVLPISGSWRSLPQFSSTDPTNTVALGPAHRSWAHIYPSGVGGSSYVGDNVTEFYGFRTALYTKAFSGAWANLSRGGGYSAGALQPAAWSFASFGNDIWAVNGVDDMQRRTDNAGNFANGVTSAFLPIPRFVATIRDFLAVANLNQASYAADHVAISDVGDATYFSPADATRPSSVAWAQRVRSRPGQITGLVGGEYGRVLKRRSMHVISFVGSADEPWRLDEISGGIGTAWPGSVVEAPDGFVYFLGPDSFYRQIGSSPPEKVRGLSQYIYDRSLYSHALGGAPPSLMYAEDKKIQGVSVPSAGLIVWLLANGSNLYDMGVVLETDTLRWSTYEPTTLNQIATVHSVPVNVSGADWMADVAGSFWDGSVSRRWAWGTTGSHAIHLATDRFALSFSEGGMAEQVAIDGICPIVAREKADLPGSGIEDFALGALPDGTTVKLHASNDPLFVRRNDSAGTQVSPRSSSATWAEVNEQGFFPVIAEGRWFVVELTIPIGTHTIQSLPGVYVRRR